MVNALKQKYVQIIGFIFLLVINFIAVYYDTYLLSRVLRLITSTLFFVVYLVLAQKKYSPIFIALFIFIIIPDALALKHDVLVYANALSTSRLIRHIIMIAFVFKQLNYKKLNKTLMVMLFFVVLINLLMSVKVLDLIKSSLINNTQFLFMIFESLFMLILGYVATVYGLQVNTKKANYFLGATFGFIFSDTFYVLAYYLNLNVFYYLETILYLFGLVFIVVSAVSLDRKTLKLKYNTQL